MAAAAWPGMSISGTTVMHRARSVADDLGEIVHGVGAARVVTEGALPSDLGQPRKGRDLETPALVIGEVEVEHIALVEGEDVEDPLHLGQVVERPGDVEAEAPPAIPRRVRDREGANDIWLRTGQLATRGERPRDADRGRGLDHDALFSQSKRVALVARVPAFVERDVECGGIDPIGAVPVGAVGGHVGGDRLDDGDERGIHPTRADAASEVQRATGERLEPDREGDERDHPTLTVEPG